MFAALWLPMLFSLPTAVALDHSASTTAQYARFFFFGLGMIWLLSDPRCRRRLTIATCVVAAAWTVDALFQALVGFNFLGYELNPLRLQGIFHPRLRLGVASACLVPLWFEGWRLIAVRTEHRLVIPLAFLAALALPGGSAVVRLALSLAHVGRSDRSIQRLASVPRLSSWANPDNGCRDRPDDGRSSRYGSQ